jgi:uncharacterized protein (TIRG00374 family)
LYTKKNIPVFLVIGVTASGIALYLAFRKVPFSDLTAYLLSIDYLWIIPSALAILISFALRAFRWQIILEPARKVSFWGAFHPLMIGFMINCIIPGRAGELARPAILKKNENVPFSTGLATVAAERAFDVCLLIILFAVTFATVQIDPNLDIPFNQYHLNRETLLIIGAGILKLFAFLIVGIIMLSISKTRGIINKAVERIPSLFFFASAAFKEKVQKFVCTPLLRFIENFAAGFTLVRYPAKIGICFGLSFLIWCLAAASFYIMAQGCPGIELSFAEISAVMIIICFFIALPSVPGYWGIWEAGGVFALSLFGVSLKDAAGFTLANHAVQLFPVVVAGLISAIITGVNIWQVSCEDASTEQKA